MNEPYVPILFMAALGLVFAAGSVGTSLVVGPKRYNRAKLEAYECGIQPTPQAAGGGRVPIKYYLTAMLFIIFDIESIFLYPFAVAFNKLGLFALVEMVLFILTVFVAYAYVWRRGGLDWD
ncbi:NADH-quinone oxidoreductase subunit A [Terracoccus luteus]|uniref:NADH-quinone oxidoreductase subunit A n=1 Tax=Terracoccus luteus TaxID=53356 RepID=A0A495Y3M8_9MICO|nr:NADH-quinone oxidoreductase subunit A [Terracoccus luteus]MBB2986137.1 NADH-quinone oxidoreductase subunit A [Terracoccus luteus]MCP2172273.1 NADH-quinone oxidoreductase subunit A [Terracoccus luteus]RKT78888.1 NADH dehydrogenase subunit A [Terracoccus luteus]